MKNIDRSTVTLPQLREARAWILDCVWGDLDESDVADLSGEQIVRGVQRHYEGGWAQFLADVDVEDAPDQTGNRIDRLTDEPWLAEVSDILTLAEREGLTLAPSDIRGRSGDYVIDGMEWYAWLDAMTQD